MVYKIFYVVYRQGMNSINVEEGGGARAPSAHPPHPSATILTFYIQWSDDV